MLSFTLHNSHWFEREQPIYQLQSSFWPQFSLQFNLQKVLFFLSAVCNLKEEKALLMINLHPFVRMNTPNKIYIHLCKIILVLVFRYFRFCCIVLISFFHLLYGIFIAKSSQVMSCWAFLGVSKRLPDFPMQQFILFFFKKNKINNVWYMCGMIAHWSIQI